MQRSVWSDIVSWQTRRLCIDDHHFKEEETKSVGELSQCMLSNCSEMLILGKNLDDLLVDIVIERASLFTHHRISPSKTQHRIREDVDFRALKIDNGFVTNQ